MTKFKKIHNIYSKLANNNGINNYPGVDEYLDPTLTEDFIWNNLNLLHTNCIIPIVEAFGIEDIKITSAYRSTELNKLMGGTETSQHVKGYAIDLLSLSKSSSVLWNWCFQNLPEWNQLIWEFPEREDFTNADQPFSWVHISYIEGNNPKTCTMSSEVEVYHELMDEGYPEEMIKRGKYLHNIPEADESIVGFTDF